MTDLNTCEAGTAVEVLHENDTYTVTAHDNFNNEGPDKDEIRYPFVAGTDAIFDAGYLVTNKATKVVEHTTIALPEAIHAAEQMNDTLLSAPWKWFSIRRKKMQEGLIPDENGVFL